MKYELSERMAKMWIKVRHEGRVSQETAARMLGVSKKTIQNWEDGTSSPSQLRAFEYFTALGLPPLPFYFEMLYPDAFKGDSSALSDEDVTLQLRAAISALTPLQRRKLLFFFTGKHGGSVAGLIEATYVYLLLPLRDRVSTTFSILANYQTAESSGIANEHDIPPNLDILRDSVYRGLDAVLNNKSSYVNPTKR